MKESIRHILDQHDAALRTLREASRAYDAATVSFDATFLALRDTFTAIRDANHHQGLAIEAVIAANREALRLFNTGETP
jgi:hypothetical protein